MVAGPPAVERAGGPAGEPCQKVSLRAKRICRSVPWAEVISLKPLVLMIEPSARRVGEEALAPGLLKAGVLVRLKTSVRNWSMNRSVILKLRKRLASRLKTPGPRIVLRPRVPYLTAVTGAKAIGSNQEAPRPTPPRILTLEATRSAVWVLPGALSEVAAEVTVNGVPLSRDIMPLSCQPPANHEAGPLVAQRFPAPNGSS